MEPGTYDKFERVNGHKPDFEGDVDQICRDMSKRRGVAFEVVTPKPHELFLDIDSEDELKFVHEQIKMMQSYGVPVTITRETPSKDPGHYHVVASMATYIDQMQAIALQAILGSDRKRELYSWLRLTRGTGKVPVVCLFEPVTKAADDYTAF